MSTGEILIAVSRGGRFSGKIRIGGIDIPLRGFIGNDGVARFLPSLEPRIELVTTTYYYRERKKGLASQESDVLNNFGDLSFSVSGEGGFEGELRFSEASPVFSEFSSPKLPFRRGNPVPAEFLNPPSGSSGKYAIVFVVKGRAEPADFYPIPEGEGIASLLLSKFGRIRMLGWVPDGSRFSTSTRLREDGSAAFFTRLYPPQILRNVSSRDGFGGDLIFGDQANSDVMATDLRWHRIRQDVPNTFDWSGAVLVDAVGSFHQRPESFDLGQGPVSPSSGNVELVFEDGKLGSSQIFPANLNPRNGRTGRIDPNCSLFLNRGNGIFRGSFLHDDGQSTFYRGILLNKGANRGGFGFFLSRGEDGEVGGVSLESSVAP